MPINDIVDLIDAEIATRTSKGFGVKLGPDLYHELAKAGKIQLKRFTMEGTGLFPIDLPAYVKDDWAYAAYSDWDLGDLEFRVGVPEDK